MEKINHKVILFFGFLGLIFGAFNINGEMIFNLGEQFEITGIQVFFILLMVLVVFIYQDKKKSNS